MNIDIPIFRLLKLSDINGLHPEVLSYADDFNSLFLCESAKSMTDEAFQCFLILHPFQLIKTDGQYFIVAGFRSFQLAMVSMKSDDKVPALIHKNLDKVDIKTLAEADILVSRVGHSLGTNSNAQLKKLTDRLGHDECNKLIPGISSLRGITRMNRG